MAAKPAIEKERKLLQLTPVGSYKRMVGKLIISISGYSNFPPSLVFKLSKTREGEKVTVEQITMGLPRNGRKQSGKKV